MGDPVFAGDAPGAFLPARRLAPLPSTRTEAERIGDVVLLGKDASETMLRAALSGRPRWRAVHLATHGLVDEERPLLTALALTPTETEDGLLTCLEILRLAIPADLVALSAARSARGRVTPGEGVVGLPSALLSVGVPRVLGAVWNVDDAATAALMGAFYEAWHPRVRPGAPAPAAGPAREPLGAAAALREAQAFVRGHAKWRHPHYWAGWVIWGLPD